MSVTTAAVVVDLRDDLVIDLRDTAVAPDAIRVDSTYVRVVKPIIDRVGAALLLLVILPTLVLVAIAVRTTMGPGVLFRQVRVGAGGRTFSVYKFRTMRPDRRSKTVAWDGEDRRVTHKTEDDPRHTAFGRFLRKWSLDELPQLLNVLRGDMSLVGPRPELVGIVAGYEPWEHARHLVRPGLTGLWQVQGRAAGPMQLFTDMDVEYARTVSPMTDLRILARTLPAALGSQKGS